MIDLDAGPPVAAAPPVTAQQAGAAPPDVEEMQAWSPMRYDTLAANQRHR
ncbi:hypothetical protein [Dactylosporangium sp. NPDC005555]